MAEKQNIIVIGGNAAGPAAAAKAKRTAPNSSVILFEAGEHISTGTCELPYVLGGEIDNFNNIIFFTPQTFRMNKGVEVYTSHFVEQIDRRRKKVIVTNRIDGNESTFGYDKLILTTGSKTKSIPLYKNHKNLFQLKSVSDFIKIRTFLDDNNVNRVLIVGAGYIGLETAEAFIKLGMEVIIVEKTDLPMPGYDDAVRSLILGELERNNVQFFGGVEELKFNTNNDNIINININGRSIEFDLVLSAIGVEPNNTLALGANLEIGNEGGIKTDKKQQTSDQSIFAAGDNVEVINRITNRPDYMPIATLAKKQGHVAGANAAGGNEFFDSVVKNIAVKIFDKVFVHVGLTSNEAVRHQFNFNSVFEVADNLVQVMPESRKVFGKILIDKKSKFILGASFIGQSEVIGFGDIIASYVYHKIEAHKLAEINYNYTPPFSPFVNLLSVLGRKIKKEFR
ncbi:FAD/NAD(P)-binding oxidoreductase [Bacteroidota bacterium]